MSMFNTQLRWGLECLGYRETAMDREPVTPTRLNDSDLAWCIGLERAIELIDGSSNLAEAKAQILRELQQSYQNSEGELAWDSCRRTTYLRTNPAAINKEKTP